MITYVASAAKTFSSVSIEMSKDDLSPSFHFAYK